MLWPFGRSECLFDESCAAHAGPDEDDGSPTLYEPPSQDRGSRHADNRDPVRLKHFMTLAWYGQLRFPNWSIATAILVGCGLALLKYCFAVPANRIGYAHGFTGGQLKIIEEVVTLIVFALFASLVLKEALSCRYAGAHSSASSSPRPSCSSAGPRGLDFEAALELERPGNCTVPGGDPRNPPPERALQYRSPWHQRKLASTFDHKETSRGEVDAPTSDPADPRARHRLDWFLADLAAEANGGRPELASLELGDQVARSHQSPLVLSREALRNKPRSADCKRGADFAAEP